MANQDGNWADACAALDEGDDNNLCAGQGNKYAKAIQDSQISAEGFLFRDGYLLSEAKRLDGHEARLAGNNLRRAAGLAELTGDVGPADYADGAVNAAAALANAARAHVAAVKKKAKDREDEDSGETAELLRKYQLWGTTTGLKFFPFDMMMQKNFALISKVAPSPPRALALE